MPNPVIYIYIYNPQTGCFVVSQLFSGARHVKCFKLGSKPGLLYVSRISYIYIYIYIYNVICK